MITTLLSQSTEPVNMLPNMTKGALQMLVKDLEMGDNPDYLAGPNMITTVLIRGRRKQ